MSCAATATGGATAAVNQTAAAAAAEPQMITVKDTLASPTSHLYSEKIRISRDAAIFEIKRKNCCLPEGTSRYSSRYEIYNSTTRPFGKSYRELTLTNCSSSTSGGCETGSTSSSCCSETTTYVTCSSEIEPVQMTGFHQHHHHHHEDGELYSSCSSPIATLEVNGGTYGGGDVKENYDDDMTEIQIEGKIVSRLRGQADEEITEEVRGEQSELLLKQELKSELERKQRRLESDLKQAGKDDTPARKTFDDEVNAATEKSVVKIETWRSSSSSSSANGVDNVIIAQRRQQPLQSPKLLKEMIKTYEHNNNDKGRQSAKLMDDNFKEEEQHIYEPKSTKTNKIVTRCKSLLNLDLNQLQQQQEQGIYKKLGKATSEVNLIHDEKYESARQTDDTTVDDQTKEVVVNGNEIVEDKETTKKTINIAIVNNKKYPKIQLEDKFEKRMNDLLARKKHASESASAINEALANDVIVVEPTRTRRSADNNKFDSRPISSSHLNCRVTGELWKNKTVSGSFEQRYGDLCTLPRTAKSHRSQLQRHFYYHTGRPKSALKDEELPDPDKVKYARDLFENVLKFKPYSAESPPHVTTKYNTISSWKPKYQTNHNIMAEELQQPRHVVDHRKVRRTVTLETDQPTAINNNNNTTSSIGKWIDDRRSVSSGVGSDVSGEMDTDSNPRGADTSSDCSNKEESVFSSEDDEQSNKADKELNCLGQPVSSDILEKIRAFGTSVTYYGGRIVAASEGHACSPMTMTIMDEIRQHAMQDRLKAAGREQADDDDDYDESRRSTTFDERYFSVKFELRKSISCDSRLEQSGVERIIHERPHFTFVNNDPIKTESKHSVAKCRLQSPLPSSEIVTDALTEENERVDDEQLKKPDPISKYSATTTSSNDYGDIEFEEFQVLDEDQPSPPKLE